jgi:hypothetical protein
VRNSNSGNRAPLEWRPEKRIENGTVVIEINCAGLESGKKRRSLRVSRLGADNTTSAFIRPQDIAAAKDALTEAEKWLSGEGGT